MATRQPRPIPWLDRLDDGTYRPIPEHVQQVRRAFQMYLEGCTPTEIALELEATWTGTRQDRPAWDLKKVGRLLLNEAVVGDLAWDKKLGKARPIQRNQFPAVITRPEFEQTQAMLRVDDAGLSEFSAGLDDSAPRGRSIPEVDLFHGLCYCHECGQRLTPRWLDTDTAWEKVTEPLDEAAVWATKPKTDDRPVTIEWKLPSLARREYREGKHQQRELQFDLKSKQQGEDRLVVWARTPEGLDQPGVFKRSATKERRLVFWECTCEGVDDVPAFFIENFLFEVLLPAARLDLMRAFQLAPLEVAKAAQLTEQQEQLRRLAEELGALDAVQVSLRMDRLSQEVRDNAMALPRLTLLADSDVLLAERHKAFQEGKLSARQRELVRRRLWAAGTKVLLLRVPGISSPDHKFVLMGKLAELWGAAMGTQTAAMLVHLHEGCDVLITPWRSNGETRPMT